MFRFGDTEFRITLFYSEEWFRENVLHVITEIWGGEKLLFLFLSVWSFFRMKFNTKWISAGLELYYHLGEDFETSQN